MMLDLPGYTLTVISYEGSETLLYRGRRNADSAPVAVKVTRNEYPTSSELARLRREFAILQDLGDLPGVVHARALEKCGRGVALVMEDLGASSLHDLLKAQRFDVEAALKIAVALAETLGSLHERDVIHKDIKPHNVMIDAATCAPRLVDFGIAARLSREDPKATSPASLEGTLAYMSPEQTGRMNLVVDLRTDLYSLGVTLYELLTGALPFPSTDPTELIHSHIARLPTPPHERATELPRPLSDIVMRLLCKMPEERYQSARGLEADLERCLAQWTAARQIEPFALAQQDMTGELRIPQRLYGRERDVDALLSAFERVRKGATELILVSGYSGTGKSALVNELHKPIARRGGAFIRGKFDQNTRDVPLAPVAHAFRELIQQLLAEQAATLDTWRSALVDAVGPNGRLLFDLIPELELVIGPQPNVPALGPSEARNRFDLLVSRFLRVFATPVHPLALFLDDLQWADPASLRLLGLLLSDPDSKHLLLLGAYRDNEVDSAHPLMATLDQARKAGATLTEITLGPLDLPTATALVADTLRAQASAIEPLARLIFDRTQGNPFFLSQFLGALHDERLLSFDAASGAYTWDLARIRGAMATDNVIDLMLDKLHRLAPGTQRVLLLATCIGHEFDLATLSTIDERSATDAAADLWEALREGLVVPLDSAYRFLDVSAGAEAAASAVDFQISYRFLHDRVQEAAYSLIAKERKEEVHLSIGRLLWARSGRAPRDEDLLEIVRHLHRGAGGIIEEAERMEVARLNLRAGRKVKAATAYQTAAAYFAAGLELLAERAWERDYALCFELHIEGAECAFLSGAIERAEALFEVLLARSSSSLERARLYNLRMNLLSTLGKFTEAVKAGLSGLAVLGVTLPETETEQQAAFGAGLAKVTTALGGRRVEDLIHAAVLDDPEQKAVLQLLIDLTMPIYYVEPGVFGLVVLEMVNISLTHGHSDVSAFGYVCHGFVLSAVLGRPPLEGHAFGKLALALNERFQSASLAPKLYSSYAASVYRVEPLRISIYYYQRGCQAALEAGDFGYLSTNAYSLIINKLCGGYPLDELQGEVERLLVLMQRTRNVLSTETLTTAKQVIACLQGRTRTRDGLSDDSFDEGQLLARLEGKDLGSALLIYHVLKLQIHHLYGEHEAALSAADQAERSSGNAFGLYYTMQIHFYACLSLLALPGAGAPEDRERREASIVRHKARIAELAASCPENFQHQLVLIEAEEARRSGQLNEAMDLYDRAIALAKENEFPHTEALANELCANMYAGIGRVGAARGYMGDAYLGYRHWGAVAKADTLAREQGHLLPSLTRAGKRGSSSSSSSSIVGTTILGQTLVGNLRDAALVVRAAQAIASETTLPKVVASLVKIVLESAGAEQGALLLERDGRLFVEAMFGVKTDGLRVESGGAPLSTCSDLAQSVALFVARTREPVVVSDAREDRRFAADPYIAAGRAKAILCLPLLHQDRLIGVLYLENKQASSAFHAIRVELLELVSAHAAIAIENARMVADVRAANEKARRANEQLEAEVTQRTEELRVSNGELNAAYQRLQLELTQREQGERERTTLQARMIEAQRARLTEMSTPLIPITDRIMVMPLIGTVDTERAEQVLEVALQGAQQHRARVVILDITGIKQIDTDVIRMLMSSSAALRLLGTQAVLTGIRPEVARMMVQLGADLGAITTKGTLQRGIAYALQLSGELVGERSDETGMRAPARR
ncbi:AAA family ATPase [Sorangium sp. So ce321]|uniref:AAA family ATPase n=1 Tax=Sorangium sp. So ce321 TaxID=3133300 RepID=UPI003F64088E